MKQLIIKYLKLRKHLSTTNKLSVGNPEKLSYMTFIILTLTILYNI